MTRKRKNSALDFAQGRGLVFATIVSVMLLCPAARSAMPPRQTTVRGCLRTTGAHVFVLIGKDRLGYVLDGNRDVLSRHTDQEVEIAGTASGRSFDDGPGSSLQEQMPKAGKKRDQKSEAKAGVSIPGLRTIQVSSLRPISEQCAAVASAR